MLPKTVEDVKELIIRKLQSHDIHPEARNALNQLFTDISFGNIDVNELTPLSDVIGLIKEMNVTSYFNSKDEIHKANFDKKYYYAGNIFHATEISVNGNYQFMNEISISFQAYPIRHL